MLGNLIGKIAGTAVGGFMKSYGVMIIGGLAGGFLLWYVWSAERAKANNVKLELANEQLLKDKIGLIDASAMKDEALDQCIEANAQNALQATREAHRVRMAQADVAAMRGELLAHMDNDRNETEALRGRDKECRTIDEPFPDWVIDSLRD